MKHHKARRTLGRTKGEREALLRSLARSLILKGKIHTTEAKAKEVRPFIERLITKGRSENLASRRLVVSRLGSSMAAHKLFKAIAPRYRERNGGYTRIVKLSPRPGDRSRMAIIEFV